jgi:putative NADPH-quinone reductase
MPKHIAVIDGHPDPSAERFCHALAASYARGAEEAGHSTERIVLAEIDFPLLRSRADWEGSNVPGALRSAQEAIGRADHLAIIYPLWLGAAPALLKGFLEQVMRPGFAIRTGARTLKPGLLTGKSARIVVTMGMPGFVYRWYFGAHSLKSLERNILRFCGIAPIRRTLIGSVEGGGAPAHEKWLKTMQAFGREAA